MDYGKIFEKAFGNITEKYPCSDHGTAFKNVVERTRNMKTRNINWKKPVTVAASVAAAAAVVTVSAGAVLNWDIASLFQSGNAAERGEREQIVDEIDKEYNVVMNTDAVIGGTDPAREYELLGEISHTVDQTVDYENYLIHFSGYSFDGSTLKVLYDLTYKNGFEEIRQKIEQGEHRDFAPFSLWLSDEDSETLCTGAGGGPTIDFEDFGDNIPFAAEFHLRKPVTAEKGIFSFFDVRKNTDETPLDIKDAVASFEVDLTVPGVKTLELDADITETLRSGETADIYKVSVSAFGVTVYCAAADHDADIYSELAEMPVYVTYNDGTTADVSGYGSAGSGIIEPRDDGRFDHIVNISSGGTVIDVDNITAVQIFDQIINVK